MWYFVRQTRDCPLHLLIYTTHTKSLWTIVKQNEHFLRQVSLILQTCFFITLYSTWVYIYKFMGVNVCTVCAITCSFSYTLSPTFCRGNSLISKNYEIWEFAKSFLRRIRPYLFDLLLLGHFSWILSVGRSEKKKIGVPYTCNTRFLAKIEQNRRSIYIFTGLEKSILA